MDDKEQRDINVSQGNYNESIGGNYVQGNLTINEIARSRKKDLSSVQIYEIIEKLYKEYYIKYEYKDIVDSNILFFYNSDIDVKILLSSIHLEEKRKIKFWLKKYIIYFLIIIPLTIYLFFVAALIDLEAHKILGTSSSLHAFPHDFLANNLYLQSMIKVTTFGLEKYFVGMSVDIPSDRFYMTKSYWLLLLFILFIHQPYLYWSDKKNEKRLKKLKRYLIELLQQKLNLSDSLGRNH